MISELVFHLRTFRKDFLIALSYRLQFIFSFLSIFVSFIFLYLFSMLVDQGGNDALKNYGVSYLQFLFVGILVAEITSTYLNTMPNTIKNYQQTGVFEELMLSEKSELSIILASLNYPVFKLLMRLILYFLTYYLFFKELDFIIFDLTLVLAFILFAFSLVGISLFGSAITIYLKGSSIVPQAYLLISSILGGVIFPIEFLPQFLQSISTIIPTTQFLEIVRNPETYGMVMLNNKLIILFLMGFLLFLLGFISVKLALKNARKNGTLLFH